MSKPGPRVVQSSVAPFLLWALVSFLWIASGLHYSSYVFAFAILGWLFGLGFGSGLSHWRLNILSKKGEYKPNLRRIVSLLIIAIVVLFAAISFMSGMTLNSQLLLGYEFVNFTSSSVPGTYVAQMILFSRWEGKHKRIIASGGSWSGRMYVFPQANGTDDTSVH